MAPLAAASLAGKVAANTETRLGEESGAPAALLLPVPQDGGATNLSSLRGDIKGARGGAVLLESTAVGWDEGRGLSGTQSDWKAQRLGPDGGAGALRERHRDALLRVCGACGIPADLVPDGVTSTGQREGYRRWVATAADRMAAEASTKLGTPRRRGAGADGAVGCNTVRRAQGRLGGGWAAGRALARGVAGASDGIRNARTCLECGAEVGGHGKRLVCSPSCARWRRARQARHGGGAGRRTTSFRSAERGAGA